MKQMQTFKSLNHRIVYWFFRLWPFFVAAILAVIVWQNIRDGRPFDWMALLAAVGFALVARIVEPLFHSIYKNFDGRE